MNAPENIFLPDVQATPDNRRLAIQQVGVKGLRYPLQLAGAVDCIGIPSFWGCGFGVHRGLLAGGVG